MSKCNDASPVVDRPTTIRNFVVMGANNENFLRGSLFTYNKILDVFEFLD